MNERIAPETLTDLPFSSAFETEGVIYVSGQGGIDVETGEIVGSDIESQTIATMENIRRILASQGLGMEHIVKTNIYLTDRNLYTRFNDTYRTFFNAPFPARTAIYCDLNYDLLVEIDAIAVRRPL
ncbi:RidA family protein [Paenibacillus eucommiae]|uniref:2-iminobutanoate/2-iminopropanoate deaminase n=1 Tax=Paenibacillus eucommiae TaxID=1355755 RepID=A0ABS4J419_9BACL|nr:Rid family hydrolase [Paenibacillus eucommiae]MBP1994558.1 2-iminobutanoate/2-iminopropanoate deaminase [Paenibacillus eucommiae]